MPAELNNARILVTRPQGQADNLCRLIAQHGGVAERFPTLEIRPVADSEVVKTRLSALANDHWLIFISANAVNFAVQANGGKIDRSGLPRVAAVGAATAKALKMHGIAVDLQPQQGFNSEALLQTPDLQAIAGQRCLIVRGQGGRELLADSLRERGATVEYLEVYRRAMPAVDCFRLTGLLQRDSLFAVTITSGEALRNLLVMLGDKASLVLATPLVVISDRIGQMAEQMGFQRVEVAEGPSDTAILQTLITLQRGKQWPK